MSDEKQIKLGEFIELKEIIKELEDIANALRLVDKNRK